MYNFLLLILHILTHSPSSHTSFFKVVYLTTLSVSRLCSVYDRMVYEYGAVGGMRNVIGKRNTSRQFDHHESHVMICPGIDTASPLSVLLFSLLESFDFYILMDTDSNLVFLVTIFLFLDFSPVTFYIPGSLHCLVDPFFCGPLHNCDVKGKRAVTATNGFKTTRASESRMG
jgi:hypothetical protein